MLQCKASGAPPPKVHWLKDMKKVELSSRYTLLDGSLQISQSEEADQVFLKLSRYSNHVIKLSIANPTLGKV